MDTSLLETFKKLPLGGVDRRALVSLLETEGPAVARQLLAQERTRIRPAHTEIAADAVVLILGGSNGLTRALALQLLFGERAAIVGVHYDSEKLQIGAHHVAALREAAAREGLAVRFVNADACRPDTVAQLVAELREQCRAVHLVNGIAAGAPKRHAEHGPTVVPDLDVAFDPVLQVPDFSRPENIRKLGLVQVEVATAADVERTIKFMGSSTLLWAKALADAGLIAPRESVVAFCDYDFPPDDPVYGMGPLADAKRMQRETLGVVRERFGARVARLCYPAMPTTAIGAIPGGLLMYALAAEILKERGQYQSIAELATETMTLWREPWPEGDVRLDAPYQAALPEVRQRLEALRPDTIHAALGRLYEPQAEQR